MASVEILTTDVRYFYTCEAGRDMKMREGVWASLIKDTRYNNNARDGKNTCNNGTDNEVRVGKDNNGTDNEVRVGKDTRNDNDVRGGNDTSNNDVRAPELFSLREDVTMLSLNNCDIASKVCNFYKDLDYPSIPKVIAKVDDTTVVVEKIPQVPIMEWLKKSGPEGRMWTVDSTETQCLELEGRYSNIFRCIVATLSYLHSRDKCHGNLKRGIFVAESTGKQPRVCIANFSVEDIEFAKGFKNDLEDLKSLMETAVKYSQQIIINESVLPNPPALDAFYDLFRVMNQLNQFQIRDFAVFIYWAPIFYNWRDRRDFLNIVEKFSLQDIQTFKNILVYDHRVRGCWQRAIPSMRMWANRVPTSSTSFVNPLRVVYEFDNIPTVYGNSGGIYQFHRNCLHHYVGTPGKDCDQGAMEDLLNVFPDALPAIFKALIDKFHHRNCPRFRKSLTTFLTEDKKERRDDWS
ncbi:hypothetical protein RHMOL_Rhmol10G0298500 [Rhododendron molle]|uniref:Uncharacterized protein n=2 Tax=Rhododendron molle TaxID=49168 RepID=A0ACC0M8S6_RHOML|nr:hypothetical protein RHMOL_Rhmol10G0298500 [Rhododendron molle]KAI8536972.1 hypothetical protein RHMOL_Rhmol10G0298500 [Rhododendron molle]